MFDYSEYLDTGPGDNALSQLAALAEEQTAAEVAVAEAERALALAKEKLKDVSEHKLPNLMEEIGLDTFQTKTGLKVEVKVQVRATLGTGERKEKAINYLMATGQGGIVKQNVVVPFGRNDGEQAKALADKLRKEGLDASFERKVEPSTLSAWVREKLENGEDIPLETFGVFRQRVTKIKL